MKQYHFLPLFVAVVFAHSLLAAVTTVTDANLADYTGAASINIAAGDTLQFSGITSAYTLSAPISGGGTLLIDGCTGTATLAGDNSSFSGALVVTNSSVTVGHVHALGSATVNIVTDSTVLRTFLYNVTGEFANNITVNTADTKTGTKAFKYNVADGCVATNSGNVVFSLFNDASPRVEFGIMNGSNGRSVFTGSLSKSGGKSTIYIYGDLTLASSLTATSLTGGNSFFLNTGSDVILEKDFSSAFSSSLQAAKGTLHFATENCLTSKILAVGTTSAAYQTIKFDGHDQDFQTVVSPFGSNMTSPTAYQQYTSSEPATMTVKHRMSSGTSGSSPAYVRLDGKLSFVYDSDDASGAQCILTTYPSYSNGTDGSITARNGTIHLGADMRFTALSALVVTNAGSIALATGSFPITCDVYLSGSGRLILSNNVSLSVNRVFYKVDDEFVQANAGEYKKGQDGLVAYLDGEGTLKVLTSPAVTEVAYHWTSEGNTSLTPAANWQENASPNLTDGISYLHFNAGVSAAEAAGDIAVYGLDFTRGTDFAFGGAGNTVTLGIGGVTVANTDGEAAHVVTIAPKLNIAELSPWTLGGNSSLVLSGGLSAAVSGAALTISGGETAVSGNSVTFAGDSSASAMSVVVTNVEKVVVASDTALPAQGLVMYDKLPDFTSVTSNGAPVEIRDIAHQFTTSEMFWTNGVFRQTGLFTLRSRSIADAHRAYIRVSGGEVQFLGGVELYEARQMFMLSGDGKLRFDGGISADASFDFRGENIASNEVHVCAPINGKLLTGRVNFVCEAENVLPNGDGSSNAPYLSLGIQSNGHNGGVIAAVDLNGYDQQVNYLVVPAYAPMGLPAGAHARITSESPATFTVKRSDDDAQMLKFSGAVNYTHDCTSSFFTLTLTNVVSDTTGELLVKNGTLVFAYGAGWGGSSNVTVAAGATLKVTETGAPTAFARADGKPSIVDLKLEADGGSYGKLDLGGNVSVRTLRIGDMFMPAGDYGSTASGAANKNDDHFTGTGKLHVRRSGLVSGFMIRIL